MRLLDPKTMKRADLEAELTAARTQVEKLSTQLASASRIAFYDSLTHLPNRHGYDRYVAALQALSRTLEFQVSLDHGRGGGLLVAQVDIDHFKSVNTMLTHFGGDAVLGQFAARLARSARLNVVEGEGAAKRCLASLMVQEYLMRCGMTGSDLVSRWGGEEFFCIFPLCYRDPSAAASVYDDADRIIKRIMDNIRREPMMVAVNNTTYETIKRQVIGNPDHYYHDAKLIINGQPQVALPISASIGYAVISWEEFTSRAEDDPAHLFRNVVDLMRRAKETGRNRAVTVRSTGYGRRAAIHVLEGRSLAKTDLAGMIR